MAKQKKPKINRSKMDFIFLKTKKLNTAFTDITPKYPNQNFSHKTVMSSTPCLKNQSYTSTHKVETVAEGPLIGQKSDYRE